MPQQHWVNILDQDRQGPPPTAPIVFDAISKFRLLLQLDAVAIGSAQAQEVRRLLLNPPGFLKQGLDAHSGQ
eukprot:1233176-Pyramimonas_sp.AAC.1